MRLPSGDTRGGNEIMGFLAAWLSEGLGAWECDRQAQAWSISKEGTQGVAEQAFLINILDNRNTSCTPTPTDQPTPMPTTLTVAWEGEGVWEGCGC